jgi:hypothetical protein
MATEQPDPLDPNGSSAIWKKFVEKGVSDVVDAGRGSVVAGA